LISAPNYLLNYEQFKMTFR